METVFWFLWVFFNSKNSSFWNLKKKIKEKNSKRFKLISEKNSEFDKIINLMGGDKMALDRVMPEKMIEEDEED